MTGVLHSLTNKSYKRCKWKNMVFCNGGK